jgi:putative intracellular protease/amidase
MQVENGNKFFVFIKRVDESVVVDKKIITSRTPKDLIGFCQAIIKEMLE